MNKEDKKDLFYCVICGQYYSEDDMVIYKRLTHQGKCRECVRKLEAQRKGYEFRGIEVAVENSEIV